MSISELRRLAILSQPAEAETVFGGRSRSWTQLAALWVALTPGAGRESGEEGQRPTLVQPATAEARDLSAAARGQRLSIDGRDWRVLAVAHAEPRPGRMTLTLEAESA